MGPPGGEGIQRKLGHKIADGYGGRIVEASNGGANHRVWQKLADGVAGTPTQRCVINKLEHGLRVNRYVVLYAVRGDNAARN